MPDRKSAKLNPSASLEIGSRLARGRTREGGSFHRAAFSCGLAGLLRHHIGGDQESSAQRACPCRSGSQPHRHRSLLAHWKNHPSAPTGSRLGSQGHRPPFHRSSRRLSRHARPIDAQPPFHEVICRSIPRLDNYETTCFAIALGSYHPASPNGQESRHKGLLHPANHLPRLEPKHLGNPDRATTPLRIGKAQNNFSSTLPPSDSDLAVQVFKDPYLFDFLGACSDLRQKALAKVKIS